MAGSKQTSPSTLCDFVFYRKRKLFSIYTMLLMFLCNSYLVFCIPEADAVVNHNQLPVVTKMVNHEQSIFLHFRIKSSGLFSITADKRTHYQTEKINFCLLSIEKHYIKLHKDLFFTKRSQPVLCTLLI